MCYFLHFALKKEQIGSEFSTMVVIKQGTLFVIIDRHACAVHVYLAIVLFLINAYKYTLN